MKNTVQAINRLIERIRSGQPPELPEGTREEHYHDPALPGFYVRLLATGVASWVVQWKRHGRQKKITIGSVLVLDRPKAVEGAKELLAKITLGLLDPHQARRERMRAAKVTLAVTVPLFFEHRKQHGDFRATTERLWNQILTGYYFKPLHNLPIDEITREQLQACIDGVAKRGKGAAKNAHTAMSVFFKWAITSGKVPEGHHNPMDNVQAPKQKSRTRVLSDDEIRSVWKACEEWKSLAASENQLRVTTGCGTRPPVNGDFSCAIQLLFLTGCRSREIGSLKRSEFDLENAEMLIPGSRTKNKRDLCVPLGDWAVQMLRSADEQAKKERPGDEQLFGHFFVRYRDEDPPWKILGMDRSTWYREGKPPALPMYYKGKAPASTISRQAANCRDSPGLHLPGVNKRIDMRIASAGGTPPVGWTIHDIRRTVRTRLAALGVNRDVAEALLGHVTGQGRTQVERTYNRYEYWPEKRQAVAMWEANLRAIIDGTAPKIERPRFGEKRKTGGAA
jgi:integrase